MKIVIFAATLIIAFAAVASMGSTGAYGKTCKNVALHGHFLNAECKTKKGAWTKSSLNISKCFTNDNGKLLAKNDAYQKSCKGCKVEKDHLKCECKTKKGKYVKASINMNSNISNIDGRLQCDKVKANEAKLFLSISSTCFDMKLKGSKLISSCQDAQGNNKNLSIDLNQHLGNINGKLQAKHTKYAKTCNKCTFKWPTLSCTCKDKKGKAVKASFGVKKHIVTKNGKLVWQN